MTLFGIDRLLADPELRKPLEGKRVALLAHPASVTKDLIHSLDALFASGLNVSAVFGPQPDPGHLFRTMKPGLLHATPVLESTGIEP